MSATVTSNEATSATMTWSCFSHVVGYTHARSNQHQRTEHGKCAMCGKKYTRTIRWGSDKSAQQWRAS